MKYRLTHGFAHDEDESEFEYYRIYRLPYAETSTRFKLAWTLVRFAFWLWTN